MQNLSLKTPSPEGSRQTNGYQLEGRSTTNLATDARNTSATPLGNTPPQGPGLKENGDPKTKDFSLDLVAIQYCFGTGKVFLNVLASAKVCLVKNKVCVH